MTRSQKILASSAVAVAAIGAPIGYVIAQDAVASKQGAPTTAPAVAPLEGTVKGMNLGAQGEANGLLIDVGDGQATLVNFPPHASSAVSAAASVGDRVTMTAVSRVGRSGRTVYDLDTLTGKDGKALQVARRPGSEKTAHVEGNVASLNYAREGEVDGAVLDDGTFVHIGPREAADLKLTVGQKLVVDGTSQSTVSGKTVIEATKVNDTTIERRAPGPKGEPRAPGPKGEPRAPGPKGEPAPR